MWKALDKHRLLTSVQSGCRVPRRGKEKKRGEHKELTFPVDDEALAPQVREDGLQFLAQIQEIRRDVGVDAESAHFLPRLRRQGRQVLVRQVHLEAQLGHRCFGSNVEAEKKMRNIRNIVDARIYMCCPFSSFVLADAISLTVARRLRRRRCGRPLLYAIDNKSTFVGKRPDHSKRRSHFRWLRFRALFSVAPRRLLRFRFTVSSRDSNASVEKGFARKDGDFEAKKGFLAGRIRAAEVGERAAISAWVCLFWQLPTTWPCCMYDDSRRTIVRCDVVALRCIIELRVTFNVFL